MCSMRGMLLAMLLAGVARGDDDDDWGAACALDEYYSGVDLTLSGDTLRAAARFVAYRQS